MPKGPPATGRVWKGSVVGMLIEEVAVVMSIGGTSERGGIEEGLCVVDLDKVPTGPEGSCWPVEDKEESIGRIAVAVWREGPEGWAEGSDVSVSKQIRIAAAAGMEATGRGDSKPTAGLMVSSATSLNAN